MSTAFVFFAPPEVEVDGITYRYPADDDAVYIRPAFEVLDGDDCQCDDPYQIAWNARWTEDGLANVCDAGGDAYRWQPGQPYYRAGGA